VPEVEQAGVADDDVQAERHQHEQPDVDEQLVDDAADQHRHDEQGGGEHQHHDDRPALTFRAGLQHALARRGTGGPPARR
jgi:hypothetical protein